ncbi:unnamed protein product [Caenorhabditis auriculariae]|uniref:Uncharacterized protein n=1 Tax=Caenorhabditis auriculariae TaxID=2777116 RepID=A0A8S1HHU3_9PELO|nr:unnamed protein product [Caenorhabditis auriculariae]
MEVGGPRGDIAHGDSIVLGDVFVEFRSKSQDEIDRTVHYLKLLSTQKLYKLSRTCVGRERLLVAKFFEKLSHYDTY